MKKSSIRTTMVAASCTSCGRCDKGCPAQIQVSEALVIYEKYVDGDTKTVEKLNGMISEGKPIDCIECGACSAHCPNGVDVKSLIRELAMLQSCQGAFGN